MDEKLAKDYMQRISADWKLADDFKSIFREYARNDFSDAMQFVNTVAAIAEEEGHHPDIFIHDYKNVRITLATHALKGLSVNDFIVAAKIDAIRKE